MRTDCGYSIDLTAQISFRVVFKLYATHSRKRLNNWRIFLAEWLVCVLFIRIGIEIAGRFAATISFYSKYIRTMWKIQQPISNTYQPSAITILPKWRRERASKRASERMSQNERKSNREGNKRRAPHTQRERERWRERERHKLCAKSTRLFCPVCCSCHIHSVSIYRMSISVGSGVTMVVCLNRCDYGGVLFIILLVAL